MDGFLQEVVRSLNYRCRFGLNRAAAYPAVAGDQTGDNRRLGLQLRGWTGCELRPVIRLPVRFAAI